eukprot:PhM_4_TR215/c0_g1_i1/m.74618/K20535/MPK1_2; mitogen-activated protein kinase 1/2
MEAQHPMACVRTRVQFQKNGTVVNQEDFDVLAKYDVRDGIGFGAFGFVASAIDRTTGEEVAIKKFKNVFAHPRLALCAVRECLLLSHFEHDNIIQLKDMIIPLGDIHTEEQLNRRKTNFDEVYIVLKKFDMNLRQLCENRSVELGMIERSFLMYQLLRGMKCIHSAHVLHRDLKPDNVLISCEFDLAICDFGTGRGITQGQGMTVTLLNQTTTQWYRAPEGTLSILSKDGSIDEGIQDWKTGTTQLHSADVWSIGCIMAELMLRRPLFPTNSSGDMKQLDKIFEVMGTPTPDEIDRQSHQDSVKRFLHNMKPRPSRFDTLFPTTQFPEEEVDLLKKMLRFDPSERISIEAALEHPYLAELHDPEDEPEGEPFVLPDDGNITVESARALIWTEMCKYHPEVKEIERSVLSTD